MPSIFNYATWAADHSGMADVSSLLPLQTATTTTAVIISLTIGYYGSLLLDEAAEEELNWRHRARNNDPPRWRGFHHHLTISALSVAPECLYETNSSWGLKLQNVFACIASCSLSSRPPHLLQVGKLWNSAPSIPSRYCSL